jgi:hypothetical protein
VGADQGGIPRQLCRLPRHMDYHLHRHSRIVNPSYR